MTFQRTMPVVTSIAIILVVAVLRDRSRSVAAVEAAIPINVPLALWVVSAGAGGDPRVAALSAGRVDAAPGQVNVNRVPDQAGLLNGGVGVGLNGFGRVAGVPGLDRPYGQRSQVWLFDLHLPALRQQIA